MTGSYTSTNGVKNTHQPSLGSEGALLGLGSNPVWWRSFLLGVWGEADVEIPAYILFKAA